MVNEMFHTKMIPAVGKSSSVFMILLVVPVWCWMDSREGGRKETHRHCITDLCRGCSSVVELVV